MADQTTDKAIETVQLRNDFYRDGHRKILIALLFCIAIILIQVVALVYVISHPPEPKYFATTTEGRIMPLVPLSEPNLSTASLLQWANTAAVAVYTYDFVNYRQSFEEARKYFTADGFNNFMAALNSSNILEAVKAKKLIVTAVATGAPVIVSQGLIAGVYTWKVQIPLLVTYQSASQVIQQSVTLTMLITRVSTLSYPNGVGIAQFIASTSGGSGLSF